VERYLTDLKSLSILQRIGESALSPIFFGTEELDSSLWTGMTQK
jgi:hypothetical protein